jgi:ferric-dicitrate binding protein FerR (iron transport regulator)
LALSEHKTLIEKEVSSIDWIERTVLPGQKLELVLPDKSKVWVNSHSIIRFPSGFGSESRDVYLEGEAFFDVTKETARPFRVFAGGLTTEVLGTQFNVKSRKQKTDVALFEGMVKVSISEKGKEQLFLSPGQLAFYFSEDSDNLQKSTFDPLNSFLWKDGIIRFENETFKTIIGKLEDWYGVSILVKDNMNQDRTVTGTFSNDNLENMLIGLGFTLDFTYVLEKDFITIYPT